MKKIIIQIFLIAITGFWACAQEVEIIEASQVKVNGLAIYGTNKAGLINKFGQPSSTTTFYNEMEEKNWELLIYTGAKFYIDNDKVVSYEMSGSNYQLEYVGVVIKPGNNISVLSSPFPNAYNKRNNRGAVLSLGFYNNGILEPSDYFILISTNSSTGLIEKIDHRSY